MVVEYESSGDDEEVGDDEETGEIELVLTDIKKKKREVFQPWKVSKMPLFITTRPAVFEPHLVH